MSRWSRRRVLVAAAVLPVPVVATSAAALTTSGAPGAPETARPAGTGAASGAAPPPGGAPVAHLEPVVDAADEIGGTASVSDTAVGVIRPVRASAAVDTVVGEGATVRMGASSLRAAAAPAGSVPFTFKASTFRINKLPPESRPYAVTAPISLTDRGVHDASGVRMSLRNGKIYEHPVGQAQYGIGLHEGYRLTGNKAYLDRSIRNAQRLVDRRVARGNGWFYPYRFPFRLHGSTETLAAPWYSMMAQGQALSLFVRLAGTTGDARWRQAADHTFASFLLPFASRKPWGVYPKDGLLRLEEYPDPVRFWGDLTYNGHVFALFGLYDYVTLTGNADALKMLRGALTTARDLVPWLRVPGYRSHYCLRHLHDSGHYHTIHIEQQQVMQAITGDEVFARNADGLYADYPPLTLGGWHGATIAFAAGRHPAYRFAPNGAVTASRVFTARRATGAPASDRARIPGRPGLWYSITAGTLKGWWVQEAPGVRFLRGTHAVLAYPLPRRASVRTTHPKAVIVPDSGIVNAVTTGYTVGSRVSVDARAALNGVDHLRLAGGPLKGRWIASSSLTLTG